jgi:hypothetical protein
MTHLQEWYEARKDCLETPMNDPEYWIKINRLSEAEDALYKYAVLVRDIENSRKEIVDNFLYPKRTNEGVRIMTHDEMIAVIQAHKDGKEIEAYSELTENWSYIHKPSWQFLTTQYRVKPPQIEAWGVVRDGEVVSVHKTQPPGPMNTDRYYEVIRLIPDPNYTQSPVGDNE